MVVVHRRRRGVLVARGGAYQSLPPGAAFADEETQRTFHSTRFYNC